MSHRSSLPLRFLLFVLAVLPLAAANSAQAQAATHNHAMYQESTSLPATERDAVISPEELVKLLRLPKDQQPLILNVGPHLLYAQAHIPGAEYIAAGSSPAAKEMLTKRVQSLPHGRSVVLYCGCCPWSRCPNIHPAYEALRSAGFTKVNMLYIADNFGANWVDKGYPIAKGE
ncbi:MAG TPA: rhodanese-like domain-containing protein [Acidisarcina sp.]|nr:rhodanese-like domain-containing protein [Acidisarcina sp.]